MLPVAFGAGAAIATAAVIDATMTAVRTTSPPMRRFMFPSFKNYVCGMRQAAERSTDVPQWRASPLLSVDKDVLNLSRLMSISQ